MPPGPTRDLLEVMTVEQVAAYLQLNKLTIYRHIRAGDLPASRIGKAYRIRKADLDWFLDSRRTRPTPRQQTMAVVPEAPVAVREPVLVGARPTLAYLWDRELALHPLEWIRGLH